MDKPILQGAVLVAAALASIGAVAGFVAVTSPEFARVVNVVPVTETVTVKRQECRDTQASKPRTSKEEPRVAGTVIGGMVGGVIGAPAAGKAADAAGGAQAKPVPHKVARKRSAASDKDRRCHVVHRTEQKVIAYDVRYRLDGRIGHVRMDHEPGERIPVKKGKLVLSGPAPRAGTSG